MYWFFSAVIKSGIRKLRENHAKTVIATGLVRLISLLLSPLPTLNESFAIIIVIFIMYA